MNLRTVELKTNTIITSRDIDVASNYIRSINSNQVNGDFVVSMPLNDIPIIIYPQSPNNEKYSYINSKKEISSVSGYGSIGFSLDAKYNYVNGSLWISDAANSRIIKMDAYDFIGLASIDNLPLAHVICPDFNAGGVFVKYFSSINTGAIRHYNREGAMLSQSEYNLSTALSSLTISESSTYLDEIPSSSSMALDYSRYRLWWVNDNMVYMMDIKNGQIITMDISASNYHNAIGLDVDLASGNCFVIAQDVRNYHRVLQIDNNNNTIISTTYVSYNSLIQDTAGIVSYSGIEYPEKLALHGFDNSVMNGDLYYNADYAYYENKSLIPFGLTDEQKESYYGSSGWTIYGKAFPYYSKWRIFVLYYDSYPVISSVWEYTKNGISTPYGTYNLNYYDNIWDQSNPYPSDSGVIS